MHRERLQDGPAEPLPSRGTLFLSASEPDALTRLRGALGSLGFDAEEPFPGVVTIDWNPQRHEQFRAQASAHLNAGDLRAIRCRVFPTGTRPTLADLMHTNSLDWLLDQAEAAWLIEVLRGARLMTYFQPIVHSNDPSEIFAYECLLRGKQPDGKIIPPDRLFGAARTAGLLYHLDRVARLTAIETAARSQITTGVFINFNPRSVYDPVHCLQSTVKAIAASGIQPERFVFEVVESDEINDIDRLLRILDFYREVGLRVALDDMGAGYSSLKLLARLKPDFIKLDMDLIRNVDRDEYKAQVASKLLELARELKVCTVVEGVETVGEWQWATEHGADFAQGYLFARPEPWPAAARGASRECNATWRGTPVTM